MPLDSPVDPKALRHDPGSPRLEARLKRALKGEVLFDRFSRGRYSTDASIYQIEPLGVALPKDKEDVAAAHICARRTDQTEPLKHDRSCVQFRNIRGEP